MLSELEKKAQIKAERRKRFQIYNTMDYFFNNSNFMDFYSKSLIEILTNSYILSGLTSNTFLSMPQQIESEDIFNSFLLTNLGINNLLKNCGLSKDIVTKINSFQKKKFLFEKLFNSTKDIVALDKKDLNFSSDSILLLKKALINGINRFKTPVITPEIFFLTLMEVKNSKLSKIIKKALCEKMNWYMLRYSLIKKIYFEELHMHNNIIKNQRYFGYLLKAQLSQSEFYSLMRFNLFKLAVPRFRDQLFKRSLQISLLSKIKYDTIYSVKFYSRKYF